MKTRRCFLILTLFLCPLAAFAAPPGGVQSLAGHYVWDEAELEGDLQAVFSPEGEGSWRVSFSFVFQGQDRQAIGTAVGSLVDGFLSGDVVEESSGNRYIFSGVVKDGIFEGDHFLKEGDEETRSGSLRLSAAEAAPDFADFG